MRFLYIFGGSGLLCARWIVKVCLLKKTWNHTYGKIAVCRSFNSFPAQWEECFILVRFLIGHNWILVLIFQSYLCNYITFVIVNESYSWLWLSLPPAVTDSINSRFLSSIESYCTMESKQHKVAFSLFYRSRHTL